MDMAAGAPTLPAPMTMTSAVLIAAMGVPFRALPREDAEGHLQEERPLRLVHDLRLGHALLAEEPVDEGRAGLGPARPHAGAGHGLDLVDVADAVADELADLSGGYPLAPADDGVVNRPLHKLAERVRGLGRLQPDPGDPLRERPRGPDLDDDGPVVGPDGLDRPD